MKLHKDKTVTQTITVLDKVICDGCGNEEGVYPFSEVIISVRDGEEGGKVDTLDYCDDCMIDRARILIEAGSTAPFLTGGDT